MFAHIREQLHDPVSFALPVFALFIVVELLAIRHSDGPGGSHGSDGSGQPRLRGYGAADTRTSLFMGLFGAGDIGALAGGVGDGGPGVAHAFKNTGERTFLIVSFNTELHDPDAADVEGVELISL